YTCQATQDSSPHVSIGSYGWPTLSCMKNFDEDTDGEQQHEMPEHREEEDVVESIPDPSPANEPGMASSGVDADALPRIILSDPEQARQLLGKAFDDDTLLMKAQAVAQELVPKPC
ncbi:MAG: hypothetical protein ACKPKO_13285, partial [Candidatus Fonsibacter sp.]